ncbi:MAG: Ser-Thr-rich GPI-anchored membrane family protein [Bacteroidota bacterium]
MNRMKLIGLIVAGLSLWATSALAQATDTLSDDDIYEMKTSAERTLQDYASAMRELINPRISKAFRDRMITEFVTPGNRQIFVDSAYIVYDYEQNHLPPLAMKERQVRTYLNDFNVFFQGDNSQERMGIYYSIRKTHDIEFDGKNYYIILDFESQYGDQLPQPRRATMQLVETSGQWEALISYVKFNLELDSPDEEAPSALEELVPQWRILADQADTLLQNGQLAEAKALLDSSFSVNQEPLTARLMGVYFEGIEELDSAIYRYEQSLALGQELDPEYQDDATALKVEQLKEVQQEQLLAQQRAEETARLMPSVDFTNVGNTYKQGKEYTINLSGNSPDPLLLQLYQNDEYISTLKSDLVNSSYTWNVPKTVEKGNDYQFMLKKPDAQAGIKSGTFSIRRKIPLGIYVGASVGVGAILYIILRDQEKPIPAPPEVE